MPRAIYRCPTLLSAPITHQLHLSHSPSEKKRERGSRDYRTFPLSTFLPFRKIGEIHSSRMSTATNLRECIFFFQRRELSAFFVSMAGARLRSNEFFSAGRERTKINLNLADGNLLTYHERLLAFVLSFSRAFAPRPRKPERPPPLLNQPFYRRNP